MMNVVVVVVVVVYSFSKYLLFINLCIRIFSMDRMKKEINNNMKNK